MNIPEQQREVDDLYKEIVVPLAGFIEDCGTPEEVKKLVDDRFKALTGKDAAKDELSHIEEQAHGMSEVALDLLYFLSATGYL